jgi:hypothetical protein
VETSPQLRAVLKGHKDVVSAVAWSPDGMRLAGHSLLGWIRPVVGHGQLEGRGDAQGAYQPGDGRGLEPGRAASGFGVRGQDYPVVGRLQRVTLAAAIPDRVEAGT